MPERICWQNKLLWYLQHMVSLDLAPVFSRNDSAADLKWVHCVGDCTRVRHAASLDVCFKRCFYVTEKWLTYLLGLAVLAEQLGAAEPARVGQRRRRARPAQPPRAVRQRLAARLLLIFTHYTTPLSLPPYHYTTHEKSQPPRYRCFMRTSGIVSPIKLRTQAIELSTPLYVIENSVDLANRFPSAPT